MLLTIGLLAMCLGVAVGIVSVALPRVTTPLSLTTFLRYAAIAGVLAVGSTVMYAVHASDRGRGSLVVADAAMTLSPAITAVGVRGFPPRAQRIATGVAVAIAVGVGVCTAVTDAETALVVKSATLAVVCAGCALAAIATTTVAPLPARLIAGAMGAYAIYSAARATVVALGGDASPLFSVEVATAVATLAVLVCGAAVILTIHPARRVAADGPHTLSVVVIDDARLLAHAYGSERLSSLVAELRAAARALDDHAFDVRHGVATALPSALATLEHEMQHSFGWNPEEIALLTEPAPARSRSDDD
ncbi:hypothetical protein [Microbacterium sp. SLBN-111]|uniref:hypothetical protein n=1 Tax=Microbacterium sp. SLBN-111 TaxID=3377733 RepID=UPI003C70B3D8